MKRQNISLLFKLLGDRKDDYGDIVGDHIMLNAGTGERIEFKHQTHSKNCLANGAITAIKFIANAQENKIYNTEEVLGL